VFFTVTARRTEDRFLLPQSVLLGPYAAVAIERAWRSWPRARRWLVAACIAAIAPAGLGVASMDGTLLRDPRYAAERFLQALPPGTHVEVYGGPIFLPRIPRQVVASRPGIEPLADRQRIDGIEEIIDPAMDPRPRSPEIIVLATELSSRDAAAPPAASRRFGLMSYRDAISRRFLRGLQDGSLGYRKIEIDACALPWPLECRVVHDSTAGEVWIYGKAPPAG
ncbi:MAG: hypothetical protein ACREJ3_10360, partial [Polyangiaceae bacterium]